MSDVIKKISCPNCKKSGTWTADNAFRPFCSHRCKLIDLGEWADEGHRIAGDPAMLDLPDEDDEESLH